MAEIISGQIIPKPSGVIKIPLTPNSTYLLQSSLPFNTTKFVIAIACTATSTPHTKPEKSVDSQQLLLKKYGFTEEGTTNALARCNGLLRSASAKNLEQMLELLEDNGLSPPQIRKVVVYNPVLFTLSAKNNIKPKLEFLNTLMNSKDVAKLVSYNSRPLHLSLEPRLKSAVLFLQKCGFEGEALARLLTFAPDMLNASEENTLRLFKQVEDFGFSKGSKMFPIALRAISGLRKDVLEQKLQHLYGLGFSEEEVLVLCRRKPKLLSVSMDKMKRNLEFLVNSAAVPLSEIVRYPDLLMYSLESRIIPRYRVMKAVKSMTEVKRMPNFRSVIRMTEKCFLNKFVNPFSDEAPFLWGIYSGVSDSEGIVEIEKDSQLPYDFSQALCL